MARVEDGRRRRRLGEVLLEAGAISEDDLQKALNRQREFGGRVGSQLVRIGAVTENVVLGFLSRASGYPAVDLDDVKVDEELRDLISREVADRHLVVPVKRSGDPRSQVLTVAMADPADLQVTDQLQFSTGCRVQPVIATESAVHRFIGRLFEGAPVESTARDNLLEYTEEGQQEEELIEERRQEEKEELVSSDSPVPFLMGKAPWKRRFTALAELLIEKGVITRDEFVAQMRKEQSRRKE